MKNLHPLGLLGFVFLLGYTLSACVEDPPDTVEMSQDEDATENLSDLLTEDMHDAQEADLPPEPVCGNGEIEEGELCDDGNVLEGDDCSAQCEPTWACGPLGGSCEDVENEATEHRIEVMDACHFALDEPTQTRDAAIDALVSRAGGALSIEDILGDLNHTGVPGLTDRHADHLQDQSWQGFRWNDEDMEVTDWFPQGISSSSDAYDSGLLANRRALLVSWYNKTDARPTKGARVSLADITDLDNVQYRHMLLVEPSLDNGEVNIEPAEYDGGNALHVGGIVWYGDYLYVADTSKGLRVFDLSRIVRISHIDNARIGVTANRLDAHGYRYAIPQLARYQLAEDSCRVRFSFAGLDRSQTPHHIITGEYKDDDLTGRIVSWPLNPATGLPEVRQGHVRATDAFLSGQTRMQGALSVDGNLYISSSSQADSIFGRLYRTRPGLEQSSSSNWTYGCEDLTYERTEDLIWTAAEWPGSRDVVGVPLRAP